MLSLNTLIRSRQFKKTYFDLMDELAKGEDYVMDKRLDRELEGFA